MGDVTSTHNSSPLLLTAPSQKHESSPPLKGRPGGLVVAISKASHGLIFFPPFASALPLVSIF